MLTEKKPIHLFLVNWIFQGKRIVAAADVRMLEVHVLGDGESRVIGLIELSKWENAKGDPNMSILINIPSSHFASTSPASFLNVCVFFL